MQTQIWRGDVIFFYPSRESLKIGIYLLDWFELVHIVSMGYLCVDNHGIVTLQLRNINLSRPLQKLIMVGIYDHDLGHGGNWTLTLESTE